MIRNAMQYIVVGLMIFAYMFFATVTVAVVTNIPTIVHKLLGVE